MARTAEDEQNRAIFLQMARVWFALVQKDETNADRNCSGGHSNSQSREPLPPYELDPMFDNPVIRNRIGEVIAKAVAKRRKPDPGNLAPTGEWHD